MKKLSEQIIIEKFKNIHGDTYDYSQVNYINTATKVKILCRIEDHGYFEKTPIKHISGQGCPKCALIKRGESQRTNINSLMDNFIKVHGKKYDYSKVEYHGNHKKVKIICKAHGLFEQEPAAHLSGQNCPKCTGNKIYTTNEILMMFSNVHGNKYDYSLMDYKFMKSKIKIQCRIHGIFEQTPRAHFNGHQCPKCSLVSSGQKRRRSIIKLIDQFNKKHGTKYDYSLVESVPANQKIKINCKDHGVFKQLPSSHLNGSGCPTCAKNGVRNKFDIIKEFENIHGKKYDYSSMKYRRPKTQIDIICRFHGVFRQTPSNHLEGNGCPICSGKKKSQNEEIINLFNKVHENKFNYSKVDYKNKGSKVKIICKVHGVFEMIPRDHLNGKVCQICSRLIQHEKRRKGIDEVLAGFRNKHGNKYDYSKVKYKNTNSKIIIICKEHGEFLQAPSMHLFGHGCAFCAKRPSYTNESIIQRFKKVHGRRCCHRRN